MKSNIHPQWHHDTVVTCSCGNTFTTGSVNATIKVDICSACHPFFTGEMKFVDRQGRVDKFMAKMQLAQQKQATAKKKTTKADSTKSNEPRSYQEILREQRATVQKAEKAAEPAPVAPASKN
ncbi:MAG: 50S ribosomal protein L31 [Candidatus Pacebacteria bacterium]|nr:50S ribosomal protein L31 [Candidatus Paceibacterota bacterium]